MLPTITIIVPVYNVEKYLPRCINSILKQSYTNFEVLLIDDGSLDRSGNICDDYSALDPRVRTFHKANGGVSSARNLGIENAKGEWIAFVDSDDYLEVDYLSELFSYTSNKTDYIVTLNTIRNYTKEMSLIISKDNIRSLFSMYKFQHYGQPWGKLYKTEIIKKVSLTFAHNIHLIEDLMFALLYLLEIESLTLITSDKYHYETGRPSSLTKNNNSYDSELAGKLELDRIVQLYVSKDQSYEDEFASHQVHLTERTLNALMKLSSREERLSNLRKLDLSIFLKYRKPYGWKEFVLLLSLKLKCFRLYDLLLHLK